jgi:hypothetical protein
MENRNDAIIYGLGADPYYRRSVILQESTVEFASEKASSSDVQKLSRTLLKAVQDYYFDWEHQLSLKSQADTLTQQLIEKYKGIFINKRLEESGETKKTLFNSSPSELNNNQKKALSSYHTVERKIQYAAALEAWKQVIRKEFSSKETTLTYDANTILKIANIPNSNSEHVFNITSGVQDQFNLWNEPRFKENTGEIYNHKFKATLFPTIELIRNGRGRQNQIKLSVNIDMAHLVFFLSRNFLAFHLEISNRLNNKTKTRLYELLIESISPARKEGAFWVISDICTRWNLSTENISKTILRTIKTPLKEINKQIGTNISYILVKRLRLIHGVEFIISDKDKEKLMGKSSNDNLCYEPHQTESFGYYLALLDYHDGLVSIDDLLDLSVTLDNKLEARELRPDKSLYEDYKHNLECYVELDNLVSKGSLPNNICMDHVTLTVINKETEEPYGKFAKDCYDEIEKMASKSQSLPGFEFKEEAKRYLVEDFFPFKFIHAGKKKVIIKPNTFKEYQKLIAIAIEYGDIDKFEFESEELRDKFQTHILGREPEIKKIEISESVTFEAEVVDVGESIETVSSFFLNSIRKENIDFQAGRELEWEKLFEQLIEKSSYSEGDFKQLVGIVSDYMTTDPDGIKFYLANLKDASWFESKWESICQKALAWNKKSRYLPDNISIFDLYEKDDATSVLPETEDKPF